MTTRSLEDLVDEARFFVDANTSRIAPEQSPTWVATMRDLADALERMQDERRIGESYLKHLKDEVERLRIELREERELTVFRVKDWKERVCEVEAENTKLRRVADGAREWLRHYDGDNGPNLREEDAISEVKAALAALDSAEDKP